MGEALIEDAGKPNLLVLNDWFIEHGRVYGHDGVRYITATLTRDAEQRPTQGGRVQGEGHTFVLSRPLGQLE